ncbi:hypothetical protein QFZ87_000777 [Bacillus sp. SLBN-46]|uniref:hypothetical protein n=1 Tax=Bacillus sp. SLBN-46 TaxID=3042283 RepID=UPI00285AB8F8|nr:hypothetical protein [Bacillus sp. SLBN-46]MDR6121180.1 hypothetical protein [Bacillus sp. SLBN-46]
MDLTYGKVTLHLTDFYNLPGDDDIQLTNIERVDLYHTTKDVFSSLGEPLGAESSEDLYTTILKYDVDGYLFRAYEEDDSTISKIDFCIPD